MSLLPEAYACMPLAVRLRRMSLPGAGNKAAVSKCDVALSCTYADDCELLQGLASLAQRVAW